eukprot:6251577-Prymnesium_polylepis.1
MVLSSRTAAATTSGGHAATGQHTVPHRSPTQRSDTSGPVSAAHGVQVKVGSSASVQPSMPCDAPAGGHAKIYATAPTAHPHGPRRTGRGRLGGWVTFAALGIPKSGHYATFAAFAALEGKRFAARFRRVAWPA